MPKPNKIHVENAYVIRVNRVRRFWGLIAATALVIAIPVATYFGTLIVVAKDNRELSSMLSRQTELVDALRAEVVNLEQLSANSELSSDVDRNSLEYMRKEMVASEAKIEVLGEQIRFYQSLMDPNPEQGGVYIETVDIEQTPQNGEYRYNIIIAQRSANHTKVKGYVDLQLISERNSEEVQTFALSELTESDDRLTLGFKFFQQLDGELILPDGFSPTKVRVTVQLEGGSSQLFEETFAWKS